jgi:hypothetical protein
MLILPILTETNIIRNALVSIELDGVSHKMLIFRSLKSFSAMKKIYALLLFILTASIFSIEGQNALAQHLPTSAGEVVFTQVKELREEELETHMLGVEAWFVKNGFSFEQVEEDDYSRDRARGRGSIEVLWGPNNFEQYFKKLKFDIEVVVKKDRYQYRFDHFVVKDGSREEQLEIYQSDTRLGSRYNPDFYREIDHKMNALIESLHTELFKQDSSSSVAITQE